VLSVGPFGWEFEIYNMDNFARVAVMFDNMSLSRKSHLRVLSGCSCLAVGDLTPTTPRQMIAHLMLFLDSFVDIISEMFCDMLSGMLNC